MSSQLKSGILLNYVNLALGAIVPILYTPIMLRLLGQEEYGLYKLSGSITSYLGLISIGLGASITRYLIKARTEKGYLEECKTLGLFINIYRIIGVITLLVGGALAYNLDTFYSVSFSREGLDKLKLLTFLLTINTSVTFLNAPYISVVTTHEKFVFTQSINILGTILLPCFNIIGLLAGYASLGLAVTSICFTILMRLIYVYQVKHSMNISPIYSKPSKELLIDILSFSFWVFIFNIVCQLYYATDTLMIGSVPALGVVSVAIYSIGETFLTIFNSLNAGITSLLIPKANKMVFSGASDEELTNIAIRAGRFQSLISALFVFGFISFGQPFIHFYVGDDYFLSYYIVIICIIPGIIPLVQSFCLNILMAKNKNKFRALTYLCIAIINVIGTWLIIPYWGIIGAATMTACASLLGNGIIMNLYYYYKIGINITRFWKNVMPIFILPIILGISSLTIAKFIDFYKITNLLGGLFIYTFLYLCITWFVVMNNEEKNIAKHFLFVKKQNHEG